MGRCFISSQARAPKECNTTDLSLPSLGWGKWEPASYGMFPGVSLNPLIGPFLAAILRNAIEPGSRQRSHVGAKNRKL